MKTKIICLIVLVSSVFGCTSKDNPEQIEKWKQEIIETEIAFSSLAQEEGIKSAFLAYAAEDAVLMRSNQIIKGKSQLETYFEKNSSVYAQYELTWEPDFVDVSTSGDLAYTYGQFTLTLTDSTGATQANSGIFHTVWKRQSNGEWRFVWD